MSGDAYLDYFQHLQGRSRLGWYYRRFYLYPKISRHLSGRVLDVGCGIGDFLHYHKNAVGLDINPHTVHYCLEQGLNAHLLEGERYPLEDGSFDSVVLDNVLEHLEDPVPTLAEIRRILCAVGRLLVGVPGRKGYEADSDHKHFYDAPGLVLTLETAGFGLERLLYAPFPSSWLDLHASQYCLYGVFSRR